MPTKPSVWMCGHVAYKTCGPQKITYIGHKRYVAHKRYIVPKRYVAHKTTRHGALEYSHHFGHQAAKMFPGLQKVTSIKKQIRWVARVQKVGVGIETVIGPGDGTAPWHTYPTEYPRLWQTRPPNRA